MSEKLLQIKRKYIASLYEEFEAAHIQLGQALSKVEQIRLKRNIDDLEGTIKQAEEQLTALELASSMQTQRPQRISTHWQEKLPLIDFKRAIGTCEQILKRFDPQGDAAIFLLQNSFNMGGKWCVQRLKDDLQRADTTGDFKPYRIEFLSYQPLDPSSFLDELGKYLGGGFHQTTFDDYAEQVIDRLCGALQSGSVVFLELGLAHNRANQERFVGWFVQDFWPRLVSRLPVLAKRLTRIKFIAMIISNKAMPTACLSDLRCTPRQWMAHKHKMVELPLHKWDEHDIQLWLLLHSGLTTPGISMSHQQITDIAREIYDSTTQGMPPAVHLALQQVLERIHQGDSL